MANIDTEASRPEAVPRTLACGCPAQHSGSRAAGRFRIRSSRYTPACSAGVHRHDEARIVLPVRGALRSDYGSTSIPIAVGGALYRPRGEDHADHYEAPTDCVALLLSEGGGFRRLDEPLVAERQAALGRAAWSLRAEAEARDDASDLVLEGLATLISTVVLDRAPLAERSAPRWVMSVREQLDECHGMPPSLAELAGSVDRDPAHVAATFRRAYGVSAGTYLRMLRLWQARDRIDEDPSSSLSDVALACGFADQSHFTRHFRRLFGIAPGAYRTRRWPVSANKGTARP